MFTYDVGSEDTFFFVLLFNFFKFLFCCLCVFFSAEHGATEDTKMYICGRSRVDSIYIFYVL